MILTKLFHSFIQCMYMYVWVLNITAQRDAHLQPGTFKMTCVQSRRSKCTSACLIACINTLASSALCPLPLLFTAPVPCQFQTGCFFPLLKDCPVLLTCTYFVLQNWGFLEITARKGLCSFSPLFPLLSKSYIIVIAPQRFLSLTFSAQ